MLSDHDYGRLEKTIRLLDSPIAGERTAALEAVGRQLDTLGLSWADIASKFRPFDAKPRHSAEFERSLLNVCRWNECGDKTVGGSPFCELHIADIIREPLGNFASFLKDLAEAVDAEIAGNALYHTVHGAVHIGMFNRYVGHDLLRAVNASRDGTGVAATIDRLAATVGVSDRGEFMMHLKRQLVLPERRSARREAAA